MNDYTYKDIKFVDYLSSDDLFDSSIKYNIIAPYIGCLVILLFWIFGLYFNKTNLSTSIKRRYYAFILLLAYTIFGFGNSFIIVAFGVIYLVAISIEKDRADGNNINLSGYYCNYLILFFILILFEPVVQSFILMIIIFLNLFRAKDSEEVQIITILVLMTFCSISCRALFLRR